MTRKDIEHVFLTIGESLSSSHLDRLVCAVEQYITEDIGGGVDFRIRLVAGSIDAGGYAAIKQLKYLKDDTGKIIPNSCGVLIWYNSRLPEIQKRIAIAHELGHVALHYKYGGKGNAARGEDQDRVAREVEATYFAKLALFRDPEYADQKAEILEAIKQMHGEQSSYDESLLADG